MSETEEWDDIVPDTPDAKASSPVRVGMFRAPGRNGLGRARLQLLFSPEFLTALGGKAWRYRVQIGRGGIRDRLRVTQDDQGPFEALEIGRGLAKKTGGAKTLRILLPPDDRFPERKIAPEAAAFRVDTRAIVIMLPSWAWDPSVSAQIDAPQDDEGRLAEAKAFRRMVARHLTMAEEDSLRAFAARNGQPLDAAIAGIVRDVLADDAAAEAAE